MVACDQGKYPFLCLHGLVHSILPQSAASAEDANAPAIRCPNLRDAASRGPSARPRRRPRGSRCWRHCSSRPTGSPSTSMKSDATTRRTRMVQLAPYLVADSIASYCTDYIDGESVEAIFEPSELDGGPRVSAVHSAGPDGTAAGMDAGILPAQRHRALPQRADRCASGRIRCSARRPSSRRRTRWRCCSRETS